MTRILLLALIVLGAVPALYINTYVIVRTSAMHADPRYAEMISRKSEKPIYYVYHAFVPLPFCGRTIKVGAHRVLAFCGLFAVILGVALSTTIVFLPKVFYVTRDSFEQMTTDELGKD